MQIKVSEKKAGQGQGTPKIGYWCGPLKYVNPTAAQLKEIYSIEGDVDEPVYQGKDKNDKEWAQLRFIFIDDITKSPVEYRIFLSKEVAEFEKDGIMKSWYINQYGQSQLVADKKDLFRSFTNIQKQNEAKEWVDVCDESGTPVELSWRKAYKGETSLYSLLRKLVTQNWYEADIDTNLFIKIDSLMRGKVSDITAFIDTDNFQSVVGMKEIQAKDGENGINYYENCVDGAWMPGWKIKEANLVTSSNGWNKYDDKANGKGKNKEMYEFYQAVKRNKHITEFAYLHDFNPDNHLNAGSSVISHSDTTEVNDTDY